MTLAILINYIIMLCIFIVQIKKLSKKKKPVVSILKGVETGRTRIVLYALLKAHEVKNMETSVRIVSAVGIHILLKFI